ncbi:ABC transporter permease [Streptomyces sp. Vc74B-19]|uniref:FtsX-like permease family protein n=1 Tax=unclassified Streptomyces TaxID=2593676 RepID=UPI001BFC725F|nr:MULTISPECIES: FtsX-like permease family protein [unclassified Streptomyces]MBT3166663.1 ABC transporter permease [Streptomyces sp. Vc74B-19]MCO4694042.1 ABC transporter permease [Streptomyces sp. RO-S4]
MRADLRLAWHLLRGSDRHEWWRIALTGVGALLATGLALAAVVLGSLRGHHDLTVAHGLLDLPGQRAGVIAALLLLLIPVLGFLGQSARLGAVHRDRRLAGLRLAGATPWQVRRIAAAETAPACLSGSAAATVLCVVVAARMGDHTSVWTWTGIAVVAAGMPLVGALTAVVTLRRVVASPLGTVRRVRPRTRPGVTFLGAVALFLAALFVAYLSLDRRSGDVPTGPVLVVGALALAGAGALWLVGATARLTGRLLAARTGSPAVLVAAERLRDDPWAAARTHTVVLLVTVVGTGFVGIRQGLLAVLGSGADMAEDPAFYTTGIDLAGAAVGIGLVITLSGLAVGTAESVATRRRTLAAQVAAGVPRAVLGRALLLETALPLAPGVLVAGVGGTAIGTWYATPTGDGPLSLPWAGLLVPVGVYAACLLAAATALPLLHRSVRPAELRYA